MIQKRVTIDETKNQVFLVDNYQDNREQRYTNILYFIFFIIICISLYYGYLHIAAIVLLIQFLYFNTPYDFAIYENLHYYFKPSNILLY